ncbi:MAG: Crp/Fnr family transcriptional regulator [Lachnospiraceae bacterium]|nr:Crp/Fnr family transcriptional regulator [Lachnospiraceae bacterium]
MFTFLQNKVSLFHRVAPETLKTLLKEEGCREMLFERGAYLCRAGDPLEGLLVVLEGKARAFKNSLLLRELGEADITGVTALFGPEACMETDIQAKSRLRALYLPRNALEKAMAADPQLARNYILFLSTRIRLLNQIIRRFSGSDATRRLAAYLLEQGKNEGTEFLFQPTRAAAELGLGRASLYRGLENLLQMGCLEKQGRSLFIVNREQLRSLTD